jgi:hypothetical protein
MLRSRPLMVGCAVVGLVFVCLVAFRLYWLVAVQGDGITRDQAVGVWTFQMWWATDVLQLLPDGTYIQTVVVYKDAKPHVVTGRWDFNPKSGNRGNVMCHDIMAIQRVTENTPMTPGPGWPESTVWDTEGFYAQQGPLGDLTLLVNSDLGWYFRKTQNLP